MPACYGHLGLFSGSRRVNFDQSSLWPSDYEGQLWRLFPCRASLPHRRRAEPAGSRDTEAWAGRGPVFVDSQLWHIGRISSAVNMTPLAPQNRETDSQGNKTALPEHWQARRWSQAWPGCRHVWSSEPPVCLALFRIRPGKTAASDVALGGSEGKKGRDCQCRWWRCKMQSYSGPGWLWGQKKVSRWVQLHRCASQISGFFFSGLIQGAKEGVVCVSLCVWFNNILFKFRLHPSHQSEVPLNHHGSNHLCRNVESSTHRSHKESLHPMIFSLFCLWELGLRVLRLKSKF